MGRATLYCGDVRAVLATLPSESVQAVVTLTDAQVGYLAGLIDGEGSLECQRQIQPRGRTPRFVIRLSFVFATPEPLTTICGWLGLSPPTRYPSTDPLRSDRWRTHVTKSIAVPLLERALPHLILKHRQAELILGIEACRVAATPSRHHFGAQAAQCVPLAAVEEMQTLLTELRSLKSSKRRMV